jgi:alkylation response protein AidB-like acyl-CoA dehydrogenase
MSTPQLEAARELRSTIDANAAKAGDAPVPQASVDALVSAGLYGVMTPKEVGGSELALLDSLDVFAEVAFADGSAGWCLMAGASTVAYFGAFAEEAFVSELFANGIPLAAGQFAPNGTGVVDGDGYRINGSYQFGSGIHCADWVGAGFLLMPTEGSDEPPQYLFTIVPKDAVQLKGNWDVLGLQSTASYDYVMEDVRAEKGASFLFAAPTRHRGGPIFELGVISLTALGHAGFAIGVVRRALAELRSISLTKVRMGSGSFLKESERFLHELGTLESRFRSLNAWTREAFAALERDVIATEKVNPKLCNVVRQATVHLTQEGADIVRQAYLLAGTTGLREGALQRCFRDIHAGSQHFFASPASTLDFARDLIGATPESAIDA